MSEHGSSDGSASSRQRLAARPAWRELDLDALGSNLAEARRRAGPGTRLIASIKADAYGHGVVAVARRDATGRTTSPRSSWRGSGRCPRIPGRS
jgi:alanine racemase